MARNEIDWVKLMPTEWENNNFFVQCSYIVWFLYCLAFSCNLCLTLLSRLVGVFFHYYYSYYVCGKLFAINGVICQRLRFRHYRSTLYVRLSNMQLKFLKNCQRYRAHCLSLYERSHVHCVHCCHLVVSEKKIVKILRTLREFEKLHAN